MSTIDLNNDLKNKPYVNKNIIEFFHNTYPDEAKSNYLNFKKRFLDDNQLDILESLDF